MKGKAKRERESMNVHAGVCVCMTERERAGRVSAGLTASECKHIIRLVAMRWRGLKRGRSLLLCCSSFPLFLTADEAVSFFPVI